VESFQPYLTYLGIGIAAIVGIALIIWAFLAIGVFTLVKNA
jgi:hypothetical protein